MPQKEKQEKTILFISIVLKLCILRRLGVDNFLTLKFTLDKSQLFVILFPPQNKLKSHSAFV